MISYDEGTEMRKIVSMTLALMMIISSAITVCAVETENNRAENLKTGKIAAGAYHTAWVYEDGSVGAIGHPVRNTSVNEWEGIVKIAAHHHTLGIRGDGSVVIDRYCDEEYYQSYIQYKASIEGWSDIIDIDANECNVAGVTSDGTVVVAGSNKYNQCNVSNWKNITDVELGMRTTYGLKSNGTVVAVGDNGSGQRKVASWNDIVAIAAGSHHVVGLRSDGTVVASGQNDDGQCNVEFWTDIIAIAAGGNHTIGLRSDGTVVAVGYNRWGQTNVGGWTDIVAIDAGVFHTVGMRSDGSLVTVGSNHNGQCSVG